MRGLVLAGFVVWTGWVTMAAMLVAALALGNPDATAAWGVLPVLMVAALSVVGAGSVFRVAYRWATRPETVKARPYNGTEWSGSGDC